MYFRLLCCLFSPASSQQQKPSALLDASLIIRNTITLARSAHQQYFFLKNRTKSPNTTGGYSWQSSSLTMGVVSLELAVPAWCMWPSNTCCLPRCHWTFSSHRLSFLIRDFHPVAMENIVGLFTWSETFSSFDNQAFLFKDIQKLLCDCNSSLMQLYPTIPLHFKKR